MRPQTLMVTAASIVTGLFLAAVGVVVAYQWIESLPPAPNAGGRVAFAPVAPPPPDILFEAPEVPRPDDLFIGGPMPFGPDQAIPQQDLPRVRGTAVLAKDYRLSGPQAHGNLAVYMIHGQDAIKDLRVLTLQEGIENNLAAVHDRCQLFIDNRSDRPLFIQGGDIVKGGNQDRTLPYDMLVPPETRGLPVAAMCVEAGAASMRRPNDHSPSFILATEQLPGRTLRIAAYRQNQAAVWKGVEDVANRTACPAASASRFTLATIRDELAAHPRKPASSAGDSGIQLATLQAAPGEEDDVIGFAVAVNGNIHSADVYGSSNLFRTLWPKLLRASAVEALAEKQPRAAATPNAETVQSFLMEAEKAPATRQAGNRTTLIRQESACADSLLYDTCDPGHENAVLHRSVLAK